MGNIRVVVIGGGATGTGILRDLSMRGIPALLVEQGDLASGTSSRFHGLLHSGARYAVNDPDAARECIEENLILRRIGRCCVEETEGYFVLTPEDDPAFVPVWLKACRDCGIPADEVPLAKARLREPHLTPEALAVFRVPDSAVDGFRLVWHNVMSARRYGGKVRTHCRVTGILTANGIVTGVRVRSAAGTTETIASEFVINATGSWAGEVAALAGPRVPVTPDRGTLLAFNHRFTGRVVNRLRKPSDGDIFVPHGSITIFGTTSVPTDRPDDTTPRSPEVLRLLDLGRPLFPAIDEFRMLRAFAGTRPLYTPDASSGRSATRNFVIIDHGEEGLEGMVTITGGKFTSYRLMAEKTVDIVAGKLGVNEPCRTAIESIIPDPEPSLAARARSLFPNEAQALAVCRLGDDLADAVALAERDPWKKLLLCECELVTLAEFETVAGQETSHSLGDIRRRTRMGMGTCQGSFCALRAVGALAENGLLAETPPGRHLANFLQERWNGIRPLLWGTQLREAELARGIFGATLNIDGDCPPPGEVPLSPVPLAASVREFERPPGPRCSRATEPEWDVVVAGAGLAGLIAAAAASAKGKSVLVVSRGGGALTIGGGTIDVLGYTPRGPVVGDPFAAMRALPPAHPYSLLGPAAVRDALGFLGDVVSGQGMTYLQAGSDVMGNAWLPTAAGTMKPVWLAGPSMNPAVLADARSIVVLGVAGMKDFSAVTVVRGLRECSRLAGKSLAAKTVDGPRRAGSALRDLTALDLAHLLDTQSGVAWLAAAIGRMEADTVFLPSILGTRPDGLVHAELERTTGKRILELFSPPPSVTGLRLQHALMRHLRRSGVRMVENADIVSARTGGGRCVALVTRNSASGQQREYPAKAFVLATGGIFGGGVVTSLGKAADSVLGIPLLVSAVQDEWSNPEFFGGGLHPFASAGLSVNERLQPLNQAGREMYANVFAAGRILGGYDFAVEKSGNGVALATGYAAGSLAGDEA